MGKDEGQNYEKRYIQYLHESEVNHNLDTKKAVEFDKVFIWNLMSEFFDILNSITAEKGELLDEN